ncbi:hypothetical protein Q9233_017268 [Columba guinea]|nr:hypothetical protein Q9233_017268 [Columba guinea]
MQALHLLTLQGRYELRVELEDFENNTAAATYGSFALSPHAVSAEEDGYTLHDLYVQNCAALSSGAWWFRSCHFSNLNGFYLGGAHLSYANGINWAQWKGFYYSLRKSEMKIRRL